MRSLHRVIKSDQMISTDNVVIIPDETPEPKAELDEEELEQPDELPVDDEIDEAGEEDEESDQITIVEEQPPAPTPEEIRRDIAESNAGGMAQSGADEIAKRIMMVARVEREKLLEQARSEAAQIREAARQEGLEQGRQQLQDRVEGCLSQVEEAMSEMQASQNSFFEEYEKELKYLALDIAQKVMQKTLSENSTELGELVRQAVGTIKGADWIQVEISDRLVTLIHQLRKEFASQQGIKSVELVPKAMPGDRCVIRTSEGVTDASIPTQLDNLRQVFQKMDEQ